MTVLSLGVESSCDEFSCGIVEMHSGKVLTSKTWSQIDLHSPYGGVVPEISPRNHVEVFTHIFQKTIRFKKLLTEWQNGFTSNTTIFSMSALHCLYQGAALIQWAAVVATWA